MDIFKILSRSTTHSKGSQTQQAQMLQASTPAQDMKVLTPQSTSTKSKKRKRKSKTSTNTVAPLTTTNILDNALDMPEELDFLDGGGGGGAQKVEMEERQVISGKFSKRRKLRNVEEASSDEETAVNKNADETEAGKIRRLDEAEIKSLLRTHKLKYTLLSRTLRSPSSIEETKAVRKARRRKEKEEKKKKKKKKKRDAKDTNKGMKGTKGKKDDTNSNVTLSESSKPDHIFPAPLQSFAELRSHFTISKRLYSNLQAQHFIEPTEVQMGSLPLLMKPEESRIVGEVDLMTVAPTGSGKTLAYAVPLIDHLIRIRKALRDKDGDEAVDNNKGIKAIILAPTRELADQIVNEIRKLVLGTGVTVMGIKKGMMPKPKSQRGPQPNKSDALDETSENEEDEEVEDMEVDETGETKMSVVKTNIIVATPLLLLHALDAYPNIFDVKQVDRFILDEADVLLDELFLEQTTGIAKYLTSPNLHYSFWSATMSSTSETLATNLINHHSSSTPRTIIRLISGIKDTSLPTISQRITYTATERGKLLALRQLFTSSLLTPCLIFVQTIPRAQALHQEIIYDLPTPGRIAVLHSQLSEHARSKVMDAFRAGEVWVLITTDLLSRGVDFRGVQLVINYDIPTTIASYIHRVGRTGRAQQTGCKALTFFTEEDVPYVRGIVGVMEKSGGAEGLQDWMMRSLPKTKKEDKKQLRKYGVRERQTKGETGKTRIGTGSGYDKQVEQRRKGAVEGSKRRKMQEKEDANGGGGVVEDEEWEGFSD